jgi:hypothetical protein
MQFSLPFSDNLMMCISRFSVIFIVALLHVCSPIYGNLTRVDQQMLNRMSVTVPVGEVEIHAFLKFVRDHNYKFKLEVRDIPENLKVFTSPPVAITQTPTWKEVTGKEFLNILEGISSVNDKGVSAEVINGGFLLTGCVSGTARDKVDLSSNKMATVALAKKNESRKSKLTKRIFWGVLGAVIVGKVVYDHHRKDDQQGSNTGSFTIDWN